MRIKPAGEPGERDADVDADGKFCDHCLPRMKRVGLGADQMRLKGWGRF